MDQVPPFLEHFIIQDRPSSESELVKRARLKAYDCLLEHGIPTRDQEGFRHTRFLDALFSEPIRPAYAFEGGRAAIKKRLLRECMDSTFVFINGLFRPDLSTPVKGVVALPIYQASRTYQPLLSASWTRLLQGERDPFALINLTCYQDGLFLYIPPEKKITAPIHILYAMGDLEEPSWSMPRVHLVAGTRSEVTLIETFHSLQDDHLRYHNCHTLFELDESATLHHVHIALDEQKTSTIHTDSVRAFLKRDATVTSTSYTAHARASRRTYGAWLQGEGSSVTFNGAWMLSQDTEAHTRVEVHHEEPHTRSMQLFKGIVQDTSRSSFEGKIDVTQKAQKTEAYQLNNNLVLGDMSQAFSKPNLAIFADDVKASHGATTGQLDAESLFYLQARGLSKQEAQKCLIEGFLSQVASQIVVDSVRDLVTHTTAQYCR